MGKCSITIELNADAGQIVKKAQEAISAVGGTFTGDAEQGSFELSTPIGLVKGAYTIQEMIISIRIHSKPLFLSCGRIEEELRHYLAA